jgi:hypothetical protein
VTDLQDLILDRLVGAKLGANLPDSPLRVAAELIEGKRPIQFTQRYNDSAMAEIARRLGFPVILAQAIQGGNGVLKSEEDRRRFAMTVFRILPVGVTPPKLTGMESARVAAATAAEVHPLMCNKRKCPWVKTLLGLAAAEKPEAYEYILYKAMCLTAHANYQDNWQTLFVDAKDGPAERLIIIGQHTECSCLKGKAKSAGFALREAVKLVMTEWGIAGAVAMVAAIARRCGMAVEGV